MQTTSSRTLRVFDSTAVVVRLENDGVAGGE